VSTHTIHPPIGGNGLADGCPRCTEISSDPFAGLDEDNLRALYDRTVAWMDDVLFPRGDNELAAMRIMEETLRRLSHLERIGIRGVTA
jgi:hypothetical protein